jgi:hypothetical protein
MNFLVGLEPLDQLGEFLATQPLLNTWIHSLMTADGFWDIAAIDPRENGQKRVFTAISMGGAERSMKLGQ